MNPGKEKRASIRLLFVMIGILLAIAVVLVIGAVR